MDYGLKVPVPDPAADDLMHQPGVLGRVDTDGRPIGPLFARVAKIAARPKESLPRYWPALQLMPDCELAYHAIRNKESEP